MIDCENEMLSWINTGVSPFSQMILTTLIHQGMFY